MAEPAAPVGKPSGRGAGTARRTVRSARPDHRIGPAGSGSAAHRYPILAGYDGSTASRRALAYAAGMARRLDRWLVVVHVWRPIGSAVVPLADLTYWLRAELTGAALTGLDIEMIVRYGSPARELCAITAERKADDRDRRSRAVPAPVRRIGGRLAGQACPVPGGNRAVNSHHGTLKQESPLRPAGVQPCQRGMRSHLTGLLRREARLLRISQEDRWSFLFSQIAVYPFVVALVSGVFLVVSFRPSMTCVTYHGWYHELDGSFSLRRIRDGMAHRAGLFGEPSSIDASPIWPQREEIVAPAGYRDADVMRVTGTAAVPGSSS